MVVCGEGVVTNYLFNCRGYVYVRVTDGGLMLVMVALLGCVGGCGFTSGRSDDGCGNSVGGDGI